MERGHHCRGRGREELFPERSASACTTIRTGAEFLDVVKKLWSSWDDDAIVADKTAGFWADNTRVHQANHHGRHFQVEGALDVPQSPQGHPVIVQAGSSENGKEFAARYAEAVFTAHETLGDAQVFYSDLKQRTAIAGRDPEAIKILSGIVPVIASTEQEARRLEQELDDLILPEYARGQLAGVLRVPAESLKLDEQLPAELSSEDQIEGAKSRYTLIVNLARREHLSVRQLIGRLGGGRGHRTFAGTPEQVADATQEWFEADAADGFNIMPPVLPRTAHLREPSSTHPAGSRALPARVTGRTLREHFGLAKPADSSTKLPLPV